MFTGVALLEYGSQEYFAGSMLNFLHGTHHSRFDCASAVRDSIAAGLTGCAVVYCASNQLEYR